MYSIITVFDITSPESNNPTAAGSRDPGIWNFPMPNLGIEKTGPGLESLVVGLQFFFVLRAGVTDPISIPTFSGDSFLLYDDPFVMDRWVIADYFTC